MILKDWITNKLKNGLSRKQIYKLYDNYIKETGAEIGEDTFKRSIRRYTEENEEKYEETRDYESNTLQVDWISEDIPDGLNALYEQNKLDPEKWEPKKVNTSRWHNGKKWLSALRAEFKEKNPSEPSFEEKCKIIKNIISNIKIDKISSKTPLCLKKKKNSENMVQLAPVDHHLGQISWDKEVDADYNLDTASNLFKECIADLTSKSRLLYPEKINLLIGSDYFNVDNRFGLTSNGTKQIEEARWQKTYNVGLNTIIDSIEYIKNYFPINVIIVSGNHDKERMYYIGSALELAYRNDSNVEINNTPTLRKWYRWGKTLIDVLHGDTVIKHSEPLTLSRIAKSVWNKVDFIEIHKGHLHKQKKYVYFTIDEEQGIIERFLPSLAPQDVWHNSKGYYHLRESQALAYNKEIGNIAIFKFRP